MSVIVASQDIPIYQQLGDNLVRSKGKVIPAGARLKLGRMHLFQSQSCQDKYGGVEVMVDGKTCWVMLAHIRRSLQSKPTLH